MCSQQKREEVVEDFVRNFLVRVGLHRTADIFQAEWLASYTLSSPRPLFMCGVCRYELQVMGRLPGHLSNTLPDVHAQCVPLV